MLPKTFVDPNLMRYVSQDRFNSIGNIDLAATSQDSTTGETVITYTSDPRYQGVLCQIEPNNSDEEVRRPDMTIVDNAWQIMLDRYAPDITIFSRLTTSDGQVHNIIDVQTNNIHSHTKLITEVIS